MKALESSEAILRRRYNYSNSSAQQIRSLPEKTQSAVMSVLECLYSSDQHLSGFNYAELSVGFIAKRSGCSFETARRAWHWIRERVGFISVHINLIRNLGFRIRHRKRGYKWGQHILLHKQCIDQVESICVMLGIEKAEKRQWVEVKPVKIGNNTMCRCPFHNDKNPSMILNNNAGGKSGSSVCFACMSNDGSRTTGFWIERDGKFFMSKSNKSAGRSSNITSQYNIERLCSESPIITENHNKNTLVQSCDLSNQLHNLQYRDTLSLPYRESKSITQTLVYSVDKKNGKAKRRVSKTGLIDKIRRCEKRSRKDASWGNAVAQLKETGSVVDTFLSIDQMKPSSYIKVIRGENEYYIPSKWKAESSRYILVDIDQFSSAPGESSIDRALLQKKLKAISVNSHILSGKFIAIRTSLLGFQVVFELSGTVSAQNNWKKNKPVKQHLDMIDSECLQAFRQVGFKGGHADKSSHTVGRNVRAPGYRLDKKGELYRSKIIIDNF